MLRIVISWLCLIVCILNINLYAQIQSNDVCIGIKQNVFTKIGTPSVFEYKAILGKTATSHFLIVESSTYPLPAPARNSLDYAVDIWSYLINTQLYIKIFVEWKDLGDTGVLAQCGPTSY